MAEVHRDATLTPNKLELLTPWLPTRRWYSGKSASGEPVTPTLRQFGGFRLDDPGGRVGLEVLLVQDFSGAAPVLYQVPLSYRDAPLAGADDALVGTLEHSVLGTRWVYDATADPVFAGALIDLLVGRTRAQHRSVSDTEEPSVSATTLGPASHIHLVAHEVLTGEQSNTSLLCTLADADGRPLAPIMVKLFRVISPGENPDVVLPEALSAAGSPNVPLVFGHIAATGLPGVGLPGVGPLDESPEGDVQPHRYHLAFAQELITGAEDARRVALRAAGDNVGFEQEARELGRATAEIHRTLARTEPVAAPDEADRTRIVATLRARAATALIEVPALIARPGVAAAVEQALDAVESLPAREWPPLQRIHGDYHLGQVLRAPSGTWAVIDFEGEPLRPLSERVLPDLALRDVAGMLRSFDYAGGSALLELKGTDPDAVRRWVGRAQDAFLEGYAEGGADGSAAPGPGAFGVVPDGPVGVVLDTDVLDGPLLRALLLDKALYEAVYEARNRPGWLSIPLTAIDHLLDQPDPEPKTNHNGGEDDAVPTPDERS